ncbi:hypothetical protein [Nocardia nepalensis]|uniref:hypothetical protein n=1 Tax=Nocardia nepalensis TaxID=3375448 RepID=UPI003B67D746
MDTDAQSAAQTDLSQNARYECGLRGQSEVAEEGVERFHEVLARVMFEGEQELAREQPAYPGAFDSIASLHEHGFVQTVLTGNLRRPRGFQSSPEVPEPMFQRRARFSG